MTRYSLVIDDLKAWLEDYVGEELLAAEDILEHIDKLEDYYE